MAAHMFTPGDTVRLVKPGIHTPAGTLGTVLGPAEYDGL